jgi:3-methyladenine DNA glycosylase Mpg
MALNKVEFGYCGILIRAIYDIDNQTMIEGPCLTVNKILSLYECDSIPTFVKQTVGTLSINSKLSVTANHRNFVIQNDNTLKDEVIYCGRRVGLSDKYPEWKDKPYRFLIMKNKIKKQKTGLVEC